MKNVPFVTGLLAGPNRPANAEASSAVLQLLMSTDANAFASGDTRIFADIFDVIRTKGVERGDAHKLTLATLIALPDHLDDIWNSFQFHSDCIQAEDPVPFVTAFPVALIEAGVWLHEQKQCSPAMYYFFPEKVKLWLTRLIQSRNGTQLENELSGRLSNNSGKFVQAFDCLNMFKVLENYDEVWTYVHSSKSQNHAGVQILSELLLKAFASLSAGQRLKVILNGGYTRPVV